MGNVDPARRRGRHRLFSRRDLVLAAAGRRIDRRFTPGRNNVPGLRAATRRMRRERWDWVVALPGPIAQLRFQCHNLVVEFRDPCVAELDFLTARLRFPTSMSSVKR